MPVLNLVPRDANLFIRPSLFVQTKLWILSSSSWLHAIQVARSHSMITPGHGKHSKASRLQTAADFVEFTKRKPMPATLFLDEAGRGSFFIF